MDVRGGRRGSGKGRGGELAVASPHVPPSSTEGATQGAAGKAPAAVAEARTPTDAPDAPPEAYTLVTTAAAARAARAALAAAPLWAMAAVAAPPGGGGGAGVAIAADGIGVYCLDVAALGVGGAGGDPFWRLRGAVGAPAAGQWWPPTVWAPWRPASPTPTETA